MRSILEKYVSKNDKIIDECFVILFYETAT
jgi:hypothetical protein